MTPPQWRIVFSSFNEFVKKWRGQSVKWCFPNQSCQLVGCNKMQFGYWFENNKLFNNFTSEWFNSLNISFHITEEKRGIDDVSERISVSEKIEILTKNETWQFSDLWLWLCMIKAARSFLVPQQSETSFTLWNSELCYVFKKCVQNQICEFEKYIRHILTIECIGNYDMNVTNQSTNVGACTCYRIHWNRFRRLKVAFLLLLKSSFHTRMKHYQSKIKEFSVEEENKWWRLQRRIRITVHRMTNALIDTTF